MIGGGGDLISLDFAGAGGGGALASLADALPTDPGGLDALSGSFPIDPASFSPSDLGNPNFTPTPTADMLQPLASQVNQAAQGEPFTLGVTGIDGQPLRQPVFDMSGGDAKFLGFQGPDGTLQDLEGNTVSGPDAGFKFPGGASLPSIPGGAGSIPGIGSLPGSGGAAGTSPATSTTPGQQPKPFEFTDLVPKTFGDALDLTKLLGKVLSPALGGGGPGGSSTTTAAGAHNTLGIPISTLAQLQQLIVRAQGARPGPLA